MKKAALLLVTVSACIGAGLAFLALHDDNQLIALVPGKVIPAQTLHLLDGRHEPFGEIHITTDGMVALNLWDPEPRLSIIEKADPKNPTDWGTYTLDSRTGREISVEPFDSRATAIPWLAHPMFKVTSRMVLVDQRGSAIWSAR
jgi:hypothetical protein